MNKGDRIQVTGSSLNQNVLDDLTIAEIDRNVIYMSGVTEIVDEQTVSITLGTQVRIVTTIAVNQLDDVDLGGEALGVIEVQSGGNVFLGSEKEIKLSSLHADENVRLKTGSGITNVAGQLASNIVSQDLILEAATAAIGSDSAPIRTNLAATATLTARAANDIHIVEQDSLNLETIYSQTGTIALQTLEGSIVDALNHDFTNLKANRIELIAELGIGEAGNPLDMDLVGAGTIYALGNDDIVLSETSVNMNIDRIESTHGAAKLRAQVGIVIRT